MEYKLSFHITESCCRLSATYVELSSRNRGKGHKREEQARERSARIGGRQTSKMKQGERRGMCRMTMSEKWKYCECAEGKVHRETEHRHPEYHQKWIIFRKNNWHLSCDNVRVIGLVEAAVIDSREWHHGVCHLAGVGILVTVKPENK